MNLGRHLGITSDCVLAGLEPLLQGTLAKKAQLTTQGMLDIGSTPRESTQNLKGAMPAHGLIYQVPRFFEALPRVVETLLNLMHEHIPGRSGPLFQLEYSN